MKKFRLSAFILVALVACVLFYVACSKQKEPENNEQAFIKEFQSGLGKFFATVENKTVCSPIKIDLKTAFEESYVEVFKENADVSNFNSSFKKFQYKTVKGSDYVENKITEILSTSPSETEAIKSFENLILDKNVAFSDKIDFISMKETIMYLSVSNSYLETNYITSHSGKGAQRCNSWWSSWGKCATGIIGGWITGAIGGCAGLGGVGAAAGAIVGPEGVPIGAVAGCVVGGIVGEIGGALVGAATSCD